MQDRIVVVTGGSAGLGRACALAFAKHGAHVAIIAREPGRLAEAETELLQYGRRVLAIAADVADAEALEEAADRIEAELGFIDIWVNNAMVTVFAPAEEISPAEFKRVTEVTYLGAVYGTLAALKRMRRRDRGLVIQVGSALAYRSIPLQSAYCGAKHAIRGFTDSVRAELIHERSRVRITMVQMPALNTPQFDWSLSRMPRKAQPVPPIFQPEVGASAVIWAATHQRRELYVAWPALKTIIGNKLFPGWGDRLAAREAWEGQMTREPQPALAAANLFTPVTGRQQSHGRFDSRSRSSSPELWLSKHRAWVFTAFLAATAVGLAVYSNRRSSPI